MEVRIEQSWKNALADEFGKPYFESLVRFLRSEKAAGQTIYPPGSQIFRAFDLTPLDELKVVILGQDPYHGPGQAEGLSFSVPHGVKLPPSLQNIYKEIESDTGISTAGRDGSLEHWAEQGVFLLNAVLTVRASEPTSHSRIGWTTFTDSVIKAISDHKEGVVFLLWGRPAQLKKNMLNNPKHLILEAPHPSPLSSYRGFFGNKHFSKANDYLIATGQTPIEW